METEKKILKQKLFPVTDLASGAQLVTVAASSPETLRQLCQRIKDRLATDHVRCPQAEAG
jgi:hypothetical protein